MPEQDRIGTAIAACYDAVVAPETWPAAMDRLARAFDATGAGFYPCMSPNLAIAAPVGASLSEAFEQFVTERWWAQDHRARRGVPLMLLGRKVVVEHEVVTEEERRVLPVYRRLYEPHGIPWWAAVACQPRRDALWALNLFRSDRQGPFLPRDAVDLGRLDGHFGRMIDLAHRFADAGVRAAMARFEHADLPAALIDRHGRLLVLNPAAERALGGDLSIVDGRLSARRPDENVLLQDLLDRAAAGESAPTRMVSRTAGGPLVIDAVPTRGLLSDAFGYAAAILLMRPRDVPAPSLERLLTKVFGLTPIETRLAMLLGEGQTIRSAAERLKMTQRRATGSLKGIYRKTGVRCPEGLAERLARVRRGRPQG